MKNVSSSRRKVPTVFFVLATLLLLALGSSGILHAEEGNVFGSAFCIIRYDTVKGQNSASCGSAQYPCRTRAWANARAKSCPVVSAPGAPAARATPATIVLPPTQIVVLPPTGPNEMPMPDWLASIWPDVNSLNKPELYDAPFAILSPDVAILPGSFLANFVPPSLLLPADIADFDPVLGGQ